MDEIIVLALAKKYADSVGEKVSREGFRVQVEQDRSILNCVGQEKVFYFLPKTSDNPTDGYDEYVYTNNAWEQVGSTGIDLSDYYTKTEIDNKGYLTQHQDISGKENKSNRTTVVNENSTDDQYPTAKAVNDAIDLAVSSLAIDISSAIVTLSTNSFTYDGLSKVPSVTSVVFDNQTLILGTDYAVVSSPATNAGAYTLTVNGIGNYSGTVTANWTINKAQATISGADSVSVVGIGESVSQNYTTTGDGALSFSISDPLVATVSSSGGQITVTGVAAGSATLTVTVADGANYLGTIKSVSVAVTEASTNTVFGVMWDYSLSSPALTRLTPQTDPLEVVTNCPTNEPTACVGTSGGSSEFDNYLPWSGMVRKNYVNGEIVDFTGYDNGETFVFIPEFWSKIVDDSENSKMYFYISSEELTGFTKHPGSGRYVGRYQCDANFESKPNGYAKTNISLADFRTGISGVNNDRFVYDVHTYMAIVMLYIVEWANLNSQGQIGNGVEGHRAAKGLGETDVLNYHTGRTSGDNGNCSIQYRWIENLYSNVWHYIDGVMASDGDIYICYDKNKYADSITNDYNNTGLNITYTGVWLKKEISLDNAYLFPKAAGGSSSTYLCDAGSISSGLKIPIYGGAAHLDILTSGIFALSFSFDPNGMDQSIGTRPVFKIGGET